MTAGGGKEGGRVGGGLATCGGEAGGGEAVADSAVGAGSGAAPGDPTRTASTGQFRTEYINQHLSTRVMGIAHYTGAEQRWHRSNPAYRCCRQPLP